MKGSRISSRYAKSLLDLCIEQGGTDASYADMKLVLSNIHSSHELRQFLASPVIKAGIKIKILDSLFAQHVSKLTMGFFRLLATKGREMLLGEIAESFIAQVMDHKKIVSAEVSTAAKLDKATLDQLHALTVKLAGGNVELSEKVVPELIGGFVLKVGDNMIDTSISGKLKSLQREMREMSYASGL